MALFELDQEYGTEPPKEWKPPTFQDCVAADVDLVFFNRTEHANLHTVDGVEALVVLEENATKEDSFHWEYGSKRRFDHGMYMGYCVLYIRVKDYGAMPQVGSLLTVDEGTRNERLYTIQACEEEGGVYRIILERTRQG